MNNVIDNKVTYYLEKDKKYIYKVLSNFSVDNYQVNISSQTIEVGNNSYKLDNDKVLFFNFKPDKGDIYQLKTNSSTKITIYERTSIKDNKLTEVRTNIDGTNLVYFHFEEGKEYYISITSINQSDLQLRFNPVRNLSELDLKFDENNIIEYKDQNAPLGDWCHYFIVLENGIYNYYYMLDVVTQVFEKNIKVLFYRYSDGEFIVTAEMPFYYGEFDFKHNIKEYLKKGDVIIFGYINNSYVDNELSYKIFSE